MTHTDVALLWRVFDEATALLRDLEAVDGIAGLVMAGRYIEVMRRHIEPLRRVVEDVEFHEKAKEVLGNHLSGKAN